MMLSMIRACCFYGAKPLLQTSSHLLLPSTLSVSSEMGLGVVCPKQLQGQSNLSTHTEPSPELPLRAGDHNRKVQEIKHPNEKDFDLQEMQDGKKLTGNSSSSLLLLGCSETDLRAHTVVMSHITELPMVSS